MLKKKVVVVGGGFGGLNCVRSLKKAPVDILLLDKANHHNFQPLLYQVATAALSPGNIAAPLREVLANQPNATVLLEEVIRINKEKKEVNTASGDHFSYDYLILAPGARHSYFGRPEWEPFAPGLKTINDALILREKILLAYEKAERCSTPQEAAKYLRFVLIGGGPTGIEMAGAIAEIAHKSLIRNFRHIKPEQTEIYLIEGEPQLLPAYPRDLAEQAKRYLEKMGVKVLLDSRVTDLSGEGVWVGDRFIETPNIIWAAGNQASPLLQTLHVPLDRSGRVYVDPDLSVPGYPDIFVIGDAAHAKDDKERILPGIAPVAIQEGRYVAKIIRKGGSRSPFKYFDKGNLATVGRAKAVGLFGKKKVTGFFAWIIWCVVHIFYLISFPNRLLVALQWFFLYVTNQRRVRLITRPENGSSQKNSESLK